MESEGDIDDDDDDDESSSMCTMPLVGLEGSVV
jgi:hypothetical protein